MVSRRHVYRFELRTGVGCLTLRVTHRPRPYRTEDHYARQGIPQSPATCISAQILGWHNQRAQVPLKITPL